MGLFAKYIYPKWMDQEGVKFLSLTENFDTSTAGGRFLIHIFAAVAEFERQLTIERTKAKLQHLKDAGMRLGAKKKLDARGMAKLKADMLNPKLTNAEIAERNGIGVSSIQWYYPGGRRALIAADATKRKR